MSPHGRNVSEIPSNWSWTTLDVACDKIQDGTHFSPKKQLSSGRYRYITAKNIRPSGLDLSDVTYLEEQDHRVIYVRCDTRKGDVLLVKDGVNTGDAATNTLDEEISLLSSVCMLRPKRDILTAPFLRYFLLSPEGYRLLTGQMTGTAIKRIILRRIRGTTVPIAPIPEQNRIVAEIEKQFSRLDEAVANLKRVKANLKRYRVAVLKAAVEGRLVPTEAELARREGRTYETGEQVLARILEERHRGWERGSSGERKRYLSPQPSDTSHLSPLPDGWFWASLEQLTDARALVLYGILQPGPDLIDGIPYVRPTEIIGNHIDLASIRRTSEEIAARYHRSTLTTGDIILSIVGTIGKVAMVPDPLYGGNITQSSVRIRPVPSGIIPSFLAWALRTPVLTSQYDRRRLGTAVPRLNVQDVRLLAIPLPPVAEQQRIVTEIERRFSMADESEAQVEASLRRSEGLRQAILKRAFEGRLG